MLTRVACACAVVRMQVCTEDVLPCTGLLHQHQTPRGAVQKCNKGEPVGGAGGGVGWVGHVGQPCSCTPARVLSSQGGGVG